MLYNLAQNDINERLQDFSRIFYKSANITIGENFFLREENCDLITMPLFLYLVDDIVLFMKKIHHMLDTGGLFIANFIGGTSLIDLKFAFTQAQIDLDYPHYPMIIPMIQQSDILCLVKEAGFDINISDRTEITIKYTSIEKMIKHLMCVEKIKVFLNTDKLTDEFLQKVQILYNKDFISLELITITCVAG